MKKIDTAKSKVITCLWYLQDYGSTKLEPFIGADDATFPDKKPFSPACAVPIGIFDYP